MTSPWKIDWSFIVSKYARLGQSAIKRKLHIPLTSNFDGLKFYYPEAFPAQDGRWFTKEGMEYYDVLPNLTGDTAVDIGAGVGSYSLRLSRQFRRVVAFEPNPSIHTYLVRNIQENNSWNVKPEAIAVSDADGRANLRIPVKGQDSGATIAPVHYPYVTYSGVLVRVNTVGLDSYFKEDHQSSVDLVKIDAENHELSVLNGMKTIIRQQQPVLLVEVHQKPQTLTSCDCNVCSFLKTHCEKVELHSKQRSEWNAHWVIAY